ncbi:hypothetical protein RvY_09345 [Ramazzottius varieornatus]|uniref:Tetraspanin n=1 Tax=Ramazzottius varieornatus TaxID=947166 RepID=A0A1D1VBG9_RAMVA|nr:hypothetical protein RvY_09345 [Ramazzottius varieornatus]
MPILKRFQMTRTVAYGKRKASWEKCLRYTLCSINVVTMLGGLALIAVGAWVIVDKFSLESLVGTNLYNSAAWILIGTGCATVALSLFGCFGAMRGIRCMLMTYFTILFCIFVILLLGGILGFVLRSQLDESMRQTMHDTMIRDYGFVDTVNDAWDAMQQGFGCCAVDDGYNLTNYIHSRWYEKQESPRPLVPETCCRTVDIDGHLSYVNLTECQGRYLPKNPQYYWPNPDYVYTEPCLMKGKAGVKEHAVILGSVGVSIACSLIAGMIFSMCLFKEIART